MSTLKGSDPEMIYTPGPLVASMSGSIGGTTFSHNRGGQYARRRAIPVTSTSIFAQDAKARLSHAAQVWQTLSAAQRLSWEQWADANPTTNALGNQITLSGAMAHSSFHVRADIAGQTPLVVPPILPAPDALGTLALTADIGLGNIEIAFSVTPLGAADRMWMRVAVTSSAGIVYVQNLLRLTDLSAVAEVSPLVIETEVDDRIGTLTVGQTLHIEASVFNNDTMQLSLPKKDSVLVTTT